MSGIEVTKQGDSFRWREIHSKDDLQKLFAEIMPNIRDAARELGYALGLHVGTAASTEKELIKRLENAPK